MFVSLAAHFLTLCGFCCGLSSRKLKPKMTCIMNQVHNALRSTIMSSSLMWAGIVQNNLYMQLTFHTSAFSYLSLRHVYWGGFLLFVKHSCVFPGSQSGSETSNWLSIFWNGALCSPRVSLIECLMYLISYNVNFLSFAYRFWNIE